MCTCRDRQSEAQRGEHSDQQSLVRRFLFAAAAFGLLMGVSTAFAFQWSASARDAVDARMSANDPISWSRPAAGLRDASRLDVHLLSVPTCTVGPRHRPVACPCTDGSVDAHVVPLRTPSIGL